MQYSFQAGLLRLEAEGRRAVFYLMNTSRNRNRWGVTDKALEEGLPSIKGKPIGCGKGYKLGHMKDTVDAGKFTEYMKPSTYALGMAQITDDKVWQKLVAGEWGPTSAVIESYQTHCSICGEDITKEGYDHEHIKNGPGYVVVDSFAFDRVDFVDDPAYPQAGLQEILAQAAEASEQPITLLAGYYEGREESSQSNVDRVKGPGAPPNGGSNNPEGKEQADMTKTVEELQAELKTVSDKVSKIETDLAAATTKADVTKLQGELDVLKAERHQVDVDATAEARYQAGLAADLTAEKERLKPLTAETLRMLREDAGKAKVKHEAERPAAPKAAYGKEEGDAFMAAVKAAKERMGLPLEVK